MAHILVRHPSGDLRSCKSAFLPICHRLFLDGVYVVGADGKVERFRGVKAPTTSEVTELTHTIAERVGHFLQLQGRLERDGEQRLLAGEAMDEGTMDPLLAHSISYRIAVGPQAGRKVFTLHKIAGSNFGRWSEVTAAPRERGEAHGGAEQTLPASEEPFDHPVGQVAGFSFICHGVFAPNSRDRASVTPAKRGKGAQPKAFEEAQEKTPVERHAAMSWVQRLKRVFGIDIDKSAGPPICTAEGCREAVGYREVADDKSAGPPICTAEGCRKAGGYRTYPMQPVRPAVGRCGSSPASKIQR